MDSEYDIIIIGSGAGGGTLAHHLATNSDQRILLLERGSYLRREKENWDSREVFLNKRYDADETWHDKDGRPFRPGIHYFVGGNTKVYGAALMRMREKDFEEVTHVDGISPKWPISYKDLAPYYLKAEKMYHVHGKRGEDPFDPEESEPYPYPPVSHEPRIQKLFNDLQSIKKRPFHLPIGLKLDEDNPHKSPCIRCSSFDGFPCLVNAKADAQVIAVDPALESSQNLTLQTNCFVEKLVTKGSNVTEVHVEGGKKYKAKIVVVSAGAINSAALLLRSQIQASCDVIGRHYMCHNNTALMAISTTPNNTKFQKTIGLSDFYFGDDNYSYPMGFIQMLGKSDETMLEGDAPKLTPKRMLGAMADHSLDFWLTTEDLPDINNRVIIRQDGSIQLNYTPNNQKSHGELIKRLKGMLNAIGCHTHLIPQNLYLRKTIPIGGVAHQCGTIRFGDNPKTSALDVNCKFHTLDNLYVVDGSFFPSASSVNPALTIIANAMRVGDHLLERLKS
ncbi:MAG: GMC family oxidoreductase [Waddliaceae bacterium]